MMTLRYSLATFFSASLLLTGTQAQPAYLDEPVNGFIAQQGGTFVSGNGAFISPDDQYVVTITNNCVISAYDALGFPDENGIMEPAWSMMTTGILSDTSVCNGGVAFNMMADPPYLVYMADDTNAGTRVIALDLASGNNTWASETLTDDSGNLAMSTGTPAISSNGLFIGVTFNSGSIVSNQLDTGHFALIDPAVEKDADGLVPVTFRETDENGIYSPPGVVDPRSVTPEQKIFSDQQRVNQLPVFVWNYDTTQNFMGDTVAGTDGLWGFQLPFGYTAGFGSSVLTNETAISSSCTKLKTTHAYQLKGHQESERLSLALFC